LNWSSKQAKEEWGNELAIARQASLPAELDASDKRTSDLALDKERPKVSTPWSVRWQLDKFKS
jgi:hypothetical protein